MKNSRAAQAIAYAHDQHQQFLDNLKELVRIPSVSTDPDHAADVKRAAEWTASQLRRIGMENVSIYPTALHPVVYGELLKAPENAPTLLIYGHYDVQPAEPLENWHSDPFEPEIREENLYGRGASDMKGQTMACISAVEAALSQGTLPVNVKFMIEGEEEIGSPNLGQFMKEHTDLLACDFALNTDTGMLAKDVPTITYGLRGLAFFELRVYGPAHDLHSGLFGGVVHNPAQVLCDLISGMHDENGHITLPGYYDKVLPLTEQERSELARLPVNRDTYLQQSGAPELRGEAGFTPVEQVGARPTLEVNGLLSGFTGAGAKTVLPAYAMAKISMRLVPKQDPEEVHQQLLQYLQEHAPNTVRYELIAMKGSPASISDIDLPATQAFIRALETVWGKRPVFRREGGSVPVVADMQQILGVESVLSGFGLTDDNIHGPNEKLHLPTWYRGIDTIIHFIYNLEK
jgi:acetylornithine deacetylase/succinyl-diaminopimelate desuccinylase-like protein